MLVLSGGNYHRLRVWSDVHCTARLCSGVVKTLLVLEIDKNGHGVGTISRWLPEQNDAVKIVILWLKVKKIKKNKKR